MAMGMREAVLEMNRSCSLSSCGFAVAAGCPSMLDADCGNSVGAKALAKLVLGKHPTN